MVNHQQLDALLTAITSLNNNVEAKDFFADLCTPQELEDLCLRWKIVDELKQGFTYREIKDRTGASLTTISRIAKALNYGHGGYEQIYHRNQTSK